MCLFFYVLRFGVRSLKLKPLRACEFMKVLSFSHAKGPKDSFGASLWGRDPFGGVLSFELEEPKQVASHSLRFFALFAVKP